VINQSLEQLALDGRVKPGHGVRKDSLSSPLYGMRANLGRDLIDRSLPRQMIVGTQSKRRQCILRRAAIAENSRALLPADGNGLMPLNRTEVVRNRGGHGATPHKLQLSRNFDEGGRVPKQAADTQNAVTSLRETLSDDVSIEG